MAWIHVGAVGVDLFFILSGFLLSIPFLEAARGGRPVSVPRYLERRALRILPLYWLAVVIATVVSATTPDQLLWGLPYLVFLNSFDGVAHALYPHSIPWWSLATEVQFYLLLPVIGALLGSPARRALGLGLLAAWAVGYGLILAGHTGLGFGGRLIAISSIIGRLPVFLLGILAAWIHLRWREPLRAWLAQSAFVRAGGADLAILALVLAGGALLAVVTHIGNVSANAGFRPLWHVGIAACMTAILLLVLLAPLRLRALWVNRVLGHVGLVSYSLFLIHLWPMDYVMRRFHGDAAAGEGWTPAAGVTVALLLAGCLALSELSYRFIELPFLARKARVAA
jgi:peptidoglycan/LPS O-acetylase OafA/YrhL